ncbi:MAG: penicillin-binding protein 1A [Pikeienuella sp.]
MLRVIATLFANASIAAVFAIVGIGAVVRVYGAGLPGHQELMDYQPPLLSRVYSGEGRVIAEYARERRVFVPIDEVPELVKVAFISAEDKNYYEHPGVDALAVAKAITRYAMAKLQNRPVRLAGASTITQQVMKNFLLDRDREIERKIREMILAVRFDGALTKDHILELYLNEIFFGARAYGIAAAARNYFGKALEELTLAEAAFLAGLPKAPSEIHPIRNPERALERRAYVLDQMAENGYVSQADADAAKDTPIDTILDTDIVDPLAPTRASYFTHEVRRQVIREMGRSALYEGGLTIRATIEPRLQEAAAAALRKGLERFDRERGVWRGPYAQIQAVAGGGAPDWQGALAETQLPRDITGWHPAVVLSADAEGARVGIDLGQTMGEGRIRLAAERWITRVLRDDGTTRRRPGRADELWRRGDVLFVARQGDAWRVKQIPEIQGAFMAMDPETGRVVAIQGGFSFEHSRFNRATLAKRQPGSSFKPFVYAAALDAGYAPSTIVLDAPVVVRLAGQTWRPQNSSGGFYGPTPLANGIIYSRNLMTVRIAQSVGMDRVAEYAERFGVYDNMPAHLSYALGAGETTLYDMVAAYGMFANGGRRVRPTVIDRIQDRNGNTLFRHDPRLCQGCRAPLHTPGSTPLLFDTRDQIMNPYTARELVRMMQGVVERGTAARTVGGLGFPVAGKTGTTNDSKDAWFVGFTPNMVAGCFIGYDQPRPMGRGAYGGTLCGPVFKEFMAEAMKTREPGRFPSPGFGETVLVKVDAVTGERLPDSAEGPNVVTRTFRIGVDREPIETVVRIVDDAELFDGAATSLPYEIGADQDLPYEVPAASRAARGGSGAASGSSSAAPAPQQRTAPPRPPAQLGLGTGGLY